MFSNASLNVWEQIVLHNAVIVPHDERPERVDCLENTWRAVIYNKPFDLTFDGIIEMVASALATEF